jgi:ABC-type transporter Mla MlaB component
MPSIDIGQDAHTLIVDGDVRFDNVMEIYRKGIAVMKQLHSPIEVNCAGLIHCDSSSLALCTAWIKEANDQKKSIVFTHIPSFMKDLINVHGLDNVVSQTE